MSQTSSVTPGDSDDDDGSGSDEKRRRNSAASARFRLKKKLREQRMEQTAKLLTDQTTFLQRRVNALEAEVAYLRELLVLRRDRDLEQDLQHAADTMRDTNQALAAASPSAFTHADLSLP